MSDAGDAHSVDRYDSIIIGAGHNGLVCAAYLARAGQRVLVLEAADVPGGLGALREFHEGFRASVAHTVSHFSTEVASDLQLDRHGYERASGRLRTVGLGNGSPVVLDGGKLYGATDGDAAAYERYAAQMQRFADALAPFWFRTMPRIGAGARREQMTFAKLGFALRRLGKADMHEFLRIASLPMRDLLDEHFESDVVKAMLAWDGLIGSKMAPRSPNGAVLALLYRLSAGTETGHVVPSGGIGGLMDALAKAARAAGADIRCGTAVEDIRVDGSETGLVAAGVRLADGSRIDAGQVISAADPKRTFLDLVGVRYLEIGFANRIRRLRSDGYVAKLHLALDGLPAFKGLESPDGRLIIAAEPDAIEFAYDDAKHGDYAEEPVVEAVLPSLYDPSLAPAGGHVLSANVMYVPYRLKGGWTDQARKAALERTLDVLVRHAPELRRHIVHAEFLTPADLEAEYRVSGGHWHHGDFAMDQMLMMRPTYGAAQYRTPIPGLFLASAGSHPAGDIVGAAGRNAAREVLA